MMRPTPLLLLAVVITATLAASPSEMLDAAIRQAIGNVHLVNVVAGDSIGSDQSPHTQKATVDSVDAQKIGDIIQETTRILVKEHGNDILAKFQGIDIKAVIAKFLEPSAGTRQKRQYGSGGGSDDGTDPFGKECVKRPDACDEDDQYRSISGWCNHMEDANKGWGSTMNPIRRFMGEAKYDDGFNSVRRKSANGGLLPSTRSISNKIFAEASIPAFDPKYNHMFMQYGQWIAHDIIFTPSSVGVDGTALDCSSCESANLTSNCAPIEIPDDDDYFPTTTADGRKACIRLTRAINGQTGLGPRAQLNQNSHFLDLSQVYGSTDCVTRDLRSFDNGQMRMYTGDDYTLPPQAADDSNCQSQKTDPQFSCFNAGDSRNSLHPGLIPLHTIYLKQHNKWAAQIAELKPNWSESNVFQETRRLMIAMYQYHIYQEYLPKVIGQDVYNNYTLFPSYITPLYDPTVDPSISAEFGTAAFRFGHSQARKDVPRMTNDNETIGDYVDLGANIFYTDSLYDRDATVYSIAQGYMNSPAMAADRQFSFPMRNQIFETRGMKASGIDLPAVNVQRAREMGVQGYNEVRDKIPGVRSQTMFNGFWAEMDRENIELLKTVYDSVDDVDLYVGILLEKPKDKTALLGITGATLIADQFDAFKRGDRFFFQNSDQPGALTRAEYDAIRNFSFSQLICENTDGMEYVQSDVFQHNSDLLTCCEFAPFPMEEIMSARSI